MKDSLLARLVALCFLVLSVSGHAGAEIDRKRMRRDLSIMEDVLRNLYAHVNTSVPGLSEPRVRGLYFENHGAIFLIEDHSSGRLVGLRGPEQAALMALEIKTVEEAKGYPEKRRAAIEDAKGYQEIRRAAIEDQLGEFLCTYADAIQQLKGEDRIAVLVHNRSVDPVPMVGSSVETSGDISVGDFLAGVELNSGDTVKVDLHEIDGGYRGIQFEFQKKSLFPREETFFEISAQKRDIVEYRRERIDEQEFRKRLVVREHKPDGSRMKKVQILSVILDHSLKRTDPLVTVFGTETSSMYYEGLGAVFFMSAGHGWEHSMAMGQGEPEAEVRKRFGEKLIEVVGDYGYTLRTLGPEEYIVVDVRFPAWRGNAPGLVLKVPKKEVDAFSREEMDLEEFRRKVEILEF